MKEAIKKVEELCDEVDRNSDELSKKELSPEKKRNLQSQKRDLRKKLHESVDHLRDSFLKEMREKGLNSLPSNDLVDCSRVLGRYLAYEIKIAKIRRFLDGFRRIELEKKLDLQTVALLRPKLAYAVGRSDREEKPFMERFQNFLDPMLMDISEQKDPQVFDKGLRFMESIIAYHRCYGGEN